MPGISVREDLYHLMVRSRQICPLLPGTSQTGLGMCSKNTVCHLGKWWAVKDSNLRPSD